MPSDIPTSPQNTNRGVTSLNSTGLDPEEEASTPGTITNLQIDLALTALDTVSTHDGTLTECRRKLQVAGVYQNSSPTVEKIPAAIIGEDVTEHHRAKEDAKAEFTLQSEDIIRPGDDWSADMVDVLEEDEEPARHVASHQISSEPAQAPEDDSASIHPAFEQFFMKNFSLLYTSLKQGIDATMGCSLEVKSLLLGLTSEVKLIRDEQIKIVSRLGEVSTQLETLQKVTQEGQFDLQEVRQEVSICTAGFSKINSALLQMNTMGVPQGALPSAANYHFESNPTVASVKEKTRTTPLSYSREKLIDLLKQVSMPVDKIDIMVSLLENRTARSFAMLLPQLNIYANVSDEPAKQLIQMTDIKTPEELKQAFSYLHALLSKQGLPIHEASASLYPAPLQPSECAAQPPLAARVASTRVKKCENPFGTFMKR